MNIPKIIALRSDVLKAKATVDCYERELSVIRTRFLTTEDRANDPDKELYLEALRNRDIAMIILSERINAVIAEVMAD